MPQRDSIGYTVAVALVLCVVCSLGVSIAAVALKGPQEENKRLDRQKNILDATGMAYAETGAPASELSAAQVEEFFKRIDEKLVDLETGEYVTDIDPADYDELAAAKDPERSSKITETEYPTGLRQRENIARVYFVRNEAGTIEQLVLPVYGKGLWSTMYGYMAVKSDLNTIQGLTFYQHGETPGLGGEIENPMWKAQWQDLYLFGDEGTPAAGVAKGVAPENSEYLVDGLSGATITARGVTNLVRYWVSDEAFGPFLSRVKDEIANPASTATTTETTGI
jgi:Na+-transporting NADH:ubiquinone oxidoreductase subunit C